jgi:oxygen-dependent protoporphyrinogen oxidase
VKRIAILGGGTAGVAAAYFLAQANAGLHVSLYEAGSRLGGIVETVREGGYVIEGGPDGWVTEKPWALELARELGLEDEVIQSLDETRKTYICLDGRLEAMPDGMRMMVPGNLDAVEASTLFSEEAKQAFRDEPSRAGALKMAAPNEDESVASFVVRHFGQEVLAKIAGPLLSGVFGGDVNTLSVRAVMPAFVAMEREHGSLIAALQAKTKGLQNPIFTTLRSGVGTLIEAMAAKIPLHWIRLNHHVKRLKRTEEGWLVDGRPFDAVLLATPVGVAAHLLEPTDHRACELMQMEASSAVVAAFCFNETFDLPPGFGFLVPPENVPPGQGSLLMAATFMDQKFPDRVPSGGRLVRAFFGGAAALRLMPCGNDEIASIARMELARILGPLPVPAITVIRRLPNSLPQYAVGHLDRIAELEARVQSIGNLWLLGNGYRGVGLPDLIRDARKAAYEVECSLKTGCPTSPAFQG